MATVVVVTPTGIERLVGVDERAAVAVVATLRAAGRTAVVRPDGGPRLAAWERHTAPVSFGTRLALRFAWSEHAWPAADAVVTIDGGGWGGGHPTTTMVLGELVDRVRGGERVLDVGCGSGVLGLAALALGAASVVAVDVKPEARAATVANSALNGMAGQVVVAGAVPDGTFDVVVANLGRSALASLGPALAGCVGPSGGWLAASGFSPPQAGDVAAALGPLVVVGSRTSASAEWSSLVLARSGSAPVEEGAVEVGDRGGAEE